MNVDTHAHYAPQRMLDAHVSGRASFPNVELMTKKIPTSLALPVAR